MREQGKASQERDRQIQRHPVGRNSRPVCWDPEEKRAQLGTSAPSSLAELMGRL